MKNGESGSDRLTRRELLRTLGFGMGGVAASSLLGRPGELFASEAEVGPLAMKQPHFPGTAKRVIHIFMNGGPSQIDTFDPKPALEKIDGKPIPDSIKAQLQPVQRNRVGVGFPSPWEFKKHGESGLEISELFPHVARHADDLCVVRSMVSEIANHSPGLLMMNTGNSLLSRPSLGSWVLYGLGTESEDLPGYVVLCPKGSPTAQSKNWTSAFLPGVYQGTHIETATNSDELIPNLKREDISSGTQRAQMALTRFLNQKHRAGRGEDDRLEARIHSMELAFRMQGAATDAFDVSKEPEDIREMYGKTPHGDMLLMARRLAERGVRYIQTYHGNGQPWDSHAGIRKAHARNAEQTDKPIGALLQDLKNRGMLDDTLVIWGGEMGRTPTIQGAQKDPNKVGRDHHVDGFTVWMAGGGVKGGMAYGKTDEFGFAPIENPVHVHDLHATILHTLGFDHKQLTYRYSGRDFRLTDVSGNVVSDILS
ncbi:MAG: DUF1501 domain-containing protein [Verrucomicrobiota bacterium]